MIFDDWRKAAEFHHTKVDQKGKEKSSLLRFIVTLALMIPSASFAFRTQMHPYQAAFASVIFPIIIVVGFTLFWRMMGKVSDYDKKHPHLTGNGSMVYKDENEEYK